MQPPAGMMPSDGYRPAVAVPVGVPQVMPLPAVALPGRQRRVWPDHHVQWGVPRQPWRFDIEDPAAHRGRTQHAFALGRDQVALCGFETPLVRAFIGPKQPLLALAGPDNPRCRSCAAVVVPAPPMVPHVSPYAQERRFDGRTWLDDRLGALGLPPVARADLPRTRPPFDPPWPEVDRPLLRLASGPAQSESTPVVDDDALATESVADDATDDLVAMIAIPVEPSADLDAPVFVGS